MIPNDLLYAKSHEWLKIDGENGTIGITQFAQEQLGDLTYVELPEIGASFAAGDEFGSIESVKAASELYLPVGGEVIAVNELLADAPEKVNEDRVRGRLAHQDKDFRHSRGPAGRRRLSSRYRVRSALAPRRPDAVRSPYPG